MQSSEPEMRGKRAAARAAAGKYMGDPLVRSKTVHLVARLSDGGVEAYVRRHARENVLPRGRRRIGKTVLKDPVAPGDRLYVITHAVRAGPLKRSPAWVAGCAASLDAALSMAGGTVRGGNIGQVRERVWQVTVATVPRVMILETIDDVSSEEETTKDAALPSDPVDEAVEAVPPL